MNPEIQAVLAGQIPGCVVCGDAISMLESLPEQSLVIKNKEITIITGCSHPGIIQVVKKVGCDFAEPVHMILGGFHLLEKSQPEIAKIIEEFKKCGVEKVAPCHCTGTAAVKLFQKEFENGFIELKTGSLIDLK